MEKRYFIFGQEATDIYFTKGAKAVVKFIKSGGEYKLYNWFNDTPNELLAEYDGWDGYAEITETESNQFWAAAEAFDKSGN